MLRDARRPGSWQVLDPRTTLAWEVVPLSNVEAEPVETASADTVNDQPAARPVRVQVLTPREVPLGGPRAMSVRRTLPQRSRTLIGAWCFADHYGPDDVARTGGMDVPPHPHTGLQTVSWLFAGEVEHRDSLGSHALIRPGELNLMTSGYGISHSEVSTPRTTLLHGVQLWVALPGEHRDTGRDFTHHVPEAVRLDGAEVRVFLGVLAGVVSPVRTFTPLLGAQITLEPRATVTLPGMKGSDRLPTLACKENESTCWSLKTPSPFASTTMLSSPVHGRSTVTSHGGAWPGMRQGG